MLYFAILFFALPFVQGSMQVCEEVQPRQHIPVAENCSMSCSVNYHYIISNTKSDEVILCSKDSSTAVYCDTLSDCRRHHVGAYCKNIPCLCQMSSGFFILNLSVQVPELNACVISSKHFDPDLPLITFPWRSLLVVFGIIFIFAVILVCFRWISPRIRALQSKRANGSSQDGIRTQAEDINLFPTQIRRGAPRFSHYQNPQGTARISWITLWQPRHYSPRGVHYAACVQSEDPLNTPNGVSEEDKPPSYETAIQISSPVFGATDETVRGQQQVTANQ